MKLMQGDEINLLVKFTDNNGATITDKDVDVVEFMIDTIKKNYPDDCLYQDEKFCVPLTQAETFTLYSGKCLLQARIKFTDGSVCGWKNIETLDVEYSNSKEVL